ncbi:hypothetical protein L484_015474 [Morus notabilis]|uniref:Uncharacterized protein n=1 Tax=Morus notabilis TaxID=981085 RepID=W9S5Q8_9ROSA|nr:hypothetical protein L484_015474 [Morus notabilis]
MENCFCFGEGKGKKISETKKTEKGESSKGKGKDDEREFPPDRHIREMIEEIDKINGKAGNGSK